MVACRMSDAMNKHLPVLLDEVVEQLAINPDGVYVDATFGRGGHAQAILNRLSPKGALLVLDKDPEAIAFASQHFSHDKRLMALQGSFSELEVFVKRQQWFGRVDGILFDLGVSSPQLDNPERGFSFMRSGKLDMRMDISQGIDAATWIATVSEKELANTLWELGEERFSRRIARAIVTEREIAPITTTEQLAGIVSKAHPAWEKGKHPATRSFQAIRIAINHELDDLHHGLDQALEALNIGGRLLVISFHSLEDRIVKHFIQRHERGENFPAGLPIKQDRIQSRLRRVGRAIKPTEQEIALNPRARSAVLRIAEKLT
jgi:16S rRNA (cytosine1402-N4)-methyltransferase